MMNKVKDIVSLIEESFPVRYQESFDNCGLLVGDSNQEVSGVLICLDVTEKVVDEAIEKGFNLILSHHPFLFSPIKQCTGKSAAQRILIKAIKAGIAIYAAHTSADSVMGGVSGEMGRRLGLQGMRILHPQKGRLAKVIVFAPNSHADMVRSAILNAGAGSIGEYDSCSYNSVGWGTFRPGENANPYVGEKGQLHSEDEIRIESIVERALIGRVIDAMRRVHPYQEPAYDVILLENDNNGVGLGVVGDFAEAISTKEALALLAEKFSQPSIRYTIGRGSDIKRVALCGGSGAEFVADAIAAKADIYISADIKYHTFLDYQDDIVIADIGHFESEEVILDIFYEIVTKKIPTFAVAKTENKSNPINYYTTL